MFPVWIYAVAAAAIAAAAFAIGQLFPGIGVLFAALGSTMWVAFSVQRGKRLGRRR